MTPEAGRILFDYGRLGLRRARLRTRRDVERLQATLWRRQAHALEQIPDFRGRAGAPFEAFDLDAVETARSRFATRNRFGLDEAEALRLAESGAPGDGDLEAGLSTGGRGRRGVFLTTSQERSTYVAYALATLLPGSILRSWRIALVLRSDADLYRRVGQAGRFRFAFIESVADADERHARLAAFAPHVLIAPAHALVALAASRTRWPGLRRVLAGAEPLGGAERLFISAALGAPVDPIYQATEGFIAAPCRRGGLHLNEDQLIIESDWIDPGRRRFVPILTDLARRSQPQVRLRLEDVLEEASEPCPCGSPLRSLARVEGRLEDVWRFGHDLVFPGEVEDVLEAALPPPIPFEARQTGPQEVRLKVGEGADAGPALLALHRLVARRRPVAVRLEGGPPEAPSPKRRRVRGLADGRIHPTPLPGWRDGAI